jgi:hypothetical protein
MAHARQLGPLTIDAKAKPRQGECRGFSDWRLVRGRDIANPTKSKHIVDCYTTITIDDTDTASSEMLPVGGRALCVIDFPQSYRSKGSRRTLVLHHH